MVGADGCGPAATNARRLAPAFLLGHRHMPQAKQRFLGSDELGLDGPSYRVESHRSHASSGFRDDGGPAYAQRSLDPSSYRCSSPLPHKNSPPDLEPLKRPASGRFCRSGLGLITRNDTGKLSLNGLLSPELEGWPIYSTSFFGSVFNVNSLTSS